MNEESPTTTKESERYFFISYSGDRPGYPNGVMGHLAFNHPAGFPSMYYICEVLVPKKCRSAISNVVITYLFEFKGEQDFDDFVSGYDLNNQINDILKQ